MRIIRHITSASAGKRFYQSKAHKYTEVIFGEGKTGLSITDGVEVLTKVLPELIKKSQEKHF